MIDSTQIFAISALVAFAVTFYSVPKVSAKLRNSGMTGRDVNKKDKPEVPEMGGIAIIMGLVAGVLTSSALYLLFALPFPTTLVYAALASILIMAIIGIYDDFFAIAQLTKTLLPIAASVPLIVATISSSRVITIPFVGGVDFGIIYPLLLIPLGITVASNLTNMLAGFNGLEAGMGAAIFAFASLIAYMRGADTILFFSVPMLGALLAFYLFNRYPAKIFIGDVGTLAIGATLAAAVIIGNFQSLGAVLVSIYVIDFFIKAYNKFPSTKWWGELRGEKLYPLEGKVRGLCQLIMKLTGGISEQKLVFVLICAQVLVGIFAFVIFVVLK